MKKISVIIPTYNEERYLPDTFRSIVDQTYHDFELIVKDGVSTDNTVFLSKEFADKVISKRDISIGDARNQGARYAKGDVFVFLDADTYLDKRAIEFIANDFTNYNIVLLLPKYGPKLESNQSLPYIKQQLNRFFVGFENFWRKNIDRFCGGMLMPVDAVAFKKIGGFDRSLQCVEDIDLSYRIRRIGNVLCDYRVKAYFSFRRFILSGYIETLRNYGLNAIRMHFGLSQPEFETFR